MNASNDPSLFRAQAAEYEVRKLREQVTSLKVANLALTEELQKNRDQLRAVTAETAEALRLAKELLERAWAPKTHQSRTSSATNRLTRAKEN